MKKILLIVLPILVLGGGFVGLAIAGVIKVPGLTPKKAKAAPLYGEAKDKVEEKPKAAPKPKPTEAPAKPAEKPADKMDPEQGAKKLAGLWNSVPTDKLLEITKQFKDPELARVMVAMDPEKVSELLAAMDAKRSAKLSQELQRVASIVKK